MKNKILKQIEHELTMETGLYATDRPDKLSKEELEKYFFQINHKELLNEVDKAFKKRKRIDIATTILLIVSVILLIVSAWTGNGFLNLLTSAVIYFMVGFSITSSF